MSLHPWLVLALCFAAGIALATGCPVLPAWIPALAGAALFAWAGLAPEAPRQTPFRRTSWLARLRRERLFPALALLALAAGIGRCRQAERALAPGEAFFAARGGRTAAAEVELLAMPEAALSGNFAGSWHAPAALRRWDGRTVENVRLALYGNGRLDLRRGMRLGIPKLRIYPENPPAWPGAFSFRGLRRIDGLGGSARAVGGYQPLPAAERFSVDSALTALEDWRARGVAAFMRLLPDRRGAFLAAIVFGWVEGMPPDLAESFRCSGLGHVLAISGMHVGLVAAVAWVLAGCLCRGRRRRAAAVLAFVIFFVLVSGARPSAVRAGTVAVLYFGGIVCARRSRFLDSLGLAALLILTHGPLTLFSVGFQFSYLAVLFIFCLAGEVDRWRAGAAAPPDGSSDILPAAGALAPVASGNAAGGNRWLRRGGAYVAGLGGACLAAWLGTWPLVAGYFNLCSPGGLLANLLAVPLLGLSLAGGAGELLIAPWAGMGLPEWLPWLLALPVEGLLRLAEVTGDWRPAWATVLAPPQWLLWTYYGLFAAFFARNACIPGLSRLSRLKIHQWAAALALAGAMVLIYTFTSTFAENPRPGIYALAAGRHDVFCVVEPERRLSVVCTGVPRSWSEIRALCLWLGFRRVDCLVLPPKGEADAVFLRRLPCAETARALPGADGKWRGELPGGGTVSLEVPGHGAAWWLRSGRAGVFAGDGLREGWLAASGTAARALAENAVCFLQRTAVRRFAGGRVWYGQGCPVAAAVAGAAGLTARETCGCVAVSRDDGRAAVLGGAAGNELSE